MIKALLFFTAMVITAMSTAATYNTGLVYDPDYLLHDAGEGHPERPDRLKAIIAYLVQEDLLKSLYQITSQPISNQWLLEVHTEDYLQELEVANRNAPAQLDPDTRMSAQSLRVAKLAAGGVLTQQLFGVMDVRILTSYMDSSSFASNLYIDDGYDCQKKFEKST